MSLLKSLIIASEKAGNIARICRQSKHLFELLVQEKGNAESNPRFVHDFKTLADVLIQEMVRYEIGQQFPILENQIKGEENNSFCNKLGEVINVKIQKHPNETAELLEIVLNGDPNAAKLLAEEVHRNIKLEDVNLCSTNLPESDGHEYTDLGIWIDPIDSTAEYINGKELVEESGIHITGLGCVTILIGVYNKASGTPVMGIVNQPFFELIEDRWRGCCHWGSIDCTVSASCNCKSSTVSKNIICISSSEDQFVKTALKANGFTLVEAAGAGYKMLTVITGLADAYVLSKGTTFKWDTCGPQAVLKSLGGDVTNFDDAAKNCRIPVTYIDDKESGDEMKVATYCNAGGIIAYKDELILKSIVKAVKNSDKS